MVDEEAIWTVFYIVTKLNFSNIAIFEANLAVLPHVFLILVRYRKLNQHFFQAIANFYSPGSLYACLKHLSQYLAVSITEMKQSHAHSRLGA